MDQLRRYLNSLPVGEQAAYARRCGTTVGYLRKAISKRARIHVETCVSLQVESSGAVRCEALRPDVDWERVREAMARQSLVPLQGAPATPLNVDKAHTPDITEPT